MKEKLTHFKDAAKSFWFKKSKGQKGIFIGSFIIVVVLIIGIFFITSKPNLVPLYRDLSAQEAGQITSELDSEGVTHELKDDGTTVMVPEDQVDTLLVDLAGEGIPNSDNIDYSFFSENASWGTTDNEFDMIKLDAMQTELANLIKGIDGIEDAKVMINLHEGYDAGFAVGKQDGLDQYQDLLQEANQIVKSANDDYHSKLDKSEPAIVDLAIHTSRKIMDRELQADSTMLLSIVRTAIREIKDQSIVTIHVHPDYYGIVFQQKEELTRLVHGDTVLTVYANDELHTNGCVIEHPLGKIDASLDTQLQQLREVLQEVAMETGS